MQLHERVAHRLVPARLRRVPAEHVGDGDLDGDQRNLALRPARRDGDLAVELSADDRCAVGVGGTAASCEVEALRVVGVGHRQQGDRGEVDLAQLTLVPRRGHSRRCAAAICMKRTRTVSIGRAPGSAITSVDSLDRSDGSATA